MYCDLVDNGTNVDGKTVFQKSRVIRYSRRGIDVTMTTDLFAARIPLSKGIVGYSARNRVVLNIPDAYADDRFNKSVDEKTGAVRYLNDRWLLFRC